MGLWAGNAGWSDEVIERLALAMRMGLHDRAEQPLDGRSRVGHLRAPLFKGQSFALVCEGSPGPKLGRGIAVLLSTQ